MNSMTIFLIWLIISSILLVTGSYGIGRLYQSDKHELAGPIIILIISSLFWPGLIIGASVILPFYLPFALGQHHAAVAEQKKEVWQTLKK